MGAKGKKHFFLTSHYAIEIFDNRHTPGFLGWVNCQTLNNADNYNLFELSDLIGFRFDLSDTQGGLKF